MHPIRLLPFFCASGSMFPLYQLPGIQLRADGMHENANSGCLTASQSTCYDLLFSLTDNCTISCTVWSSSPAAALLMDFLYYFCFHVSLLPHICRTDRYVSSVFQKWRKYARIKVATSGLNWPQSTLLITHYRVTNLPLSVTVVCSVEILIARINYFTFFLFCQIGRASCRERV